MIKKLALAAVVATAFAATPATAAHVVYVAPSADTDGDGTGNITFSPAGTGAVRGILGFDVTTAGNFVAVFEFFNPFNPAAAGGSASFNFDTDIVVFTGGNISGSGIAVPSFGATGNSIQIDRAGLAYGMNTLTIEGTLTQTPPPGNGFAGISGQLTLTGAMVPEPATWALFILGFGVIGAALRRRSGAVRVSKAQLHFS